MIHAIDGPVRVARLERKRRLDRPGRHSRALLLIEWIRPYLTHVRRLRPIRAATVPRVPAGPSSIDLRTPVERLEANFLPLCVLLLEMLGESRPIVPQLGGRGGCTDR